MMNSLGKGQWDGCWNMSRVGFRKIAIQSNMFFYNSVWRMKFAQGDAKVNEPICVNLLVVHRER